MPHVGLTIVLCGLRAKTWARGCYLLLSEAGWRAQGCSQLEHGKFPPNAAVLFHDADFSFGAAALSACVAAPNRASTCERRSVADVGYR